MMFRGLFSQVVTVALAIGIVFFYIKPTFDNIAQMQEETSLYQTEKQKVDRVNEQLNRLVSGLNSVPEADQRKLLRYIPDEVDAIAVPRVLQAIAQEAGVLFREVNYGGVDARLLRDVELAGGTDYPVPHTFSITVQGTYRQIKTFLEYLEQNEYPLEVRSLEVGVEEGSFLIADMVIATYSHLEPPVSKFDSLSI